MIRIICVGKIKEKYLKDAIEDYSKRISKYTKLEIIELKDESKISEKEILEKEAIKINKYINDKDYNIVLAIEGREMSSITFSEKLDNIFTSYSNINFIIGGSYGISESIKEKANLELSFSKMTYPHQLFRVILLEQIYRAFKIMNNESYHK